MDEGYGHLHPKTVHVLMSFKGYLPKKIWYGMIKRKVGWKLRALVALALALTPFLETTVAM